MTNAELAALFGEWQEDIDSEPFAHQAATDKLAAAWVKPPAPRLPRAVVAVAIGLLVTAVYLAVHVLAWAVR